MIDQLPYGLAVTTSLDPDEIEPHVRDALAAEGFGILTEIDMAATLHEKLGVQRPAYKVLGACNPVLANQALGVEEAIGLLLPCNVAIYRSGDATIVAAMEPEIMSRVTDNPALSEIAVQARERIVRALEKVAG